MAGGGRRILGEIEEVDAGDTSMGLVPLWASSSGFCRNDKAGAKKKRIMEVSFCSSLLYLSGSS